MAGLPVSGDLGPNTSPSQMGGELAFGELNLSLVAHLRRSGKTMFFF
jgi:hypothetical protein